MPRRFRMAVLVLGSLVLGWAPGLMAHPAVDAARTAYDDGSFVVALARLDEAENDPALNRAELIQLYWLRAASLLALGKRSAAERAFDRLVEIEPLYEPSAVDASPTLVEVFEKRRNLYRKGHEVSLGAPMLTGGADVKVPVEKHPDQANMVVVFARARGDVTYKAFGLLIQQGRAEGPLTDEMLWERAGKAGGLELVLEARNARQSVVARRGNAKQPETLALTLAQGQSAVESLRALGAAPVLPWTVPLGRDNEPLTLPPQDLPNPPKASTPAPAKKPEASPGQTEGTHGLDLPSIPLMAGLSGGGGLLVVGALGALAALATTALSTGAYAGMWAYPRQPGADASWGFRFLLGTWMGGAVAAGFLAVGALVLGAAGIGAGILGVVFR